MSKPEIKFICNKCGKLQLKDKKLSNKKWSIFSTVVKCECGGEFKMKYE